MNLPTSPTVPDLSIRRIRVNEQVRGVGALTSLSALPDGTVLLGTTTFQSESPALLRLDPVTGQVDDTGFRFPPKGKHGSDGYAIGDKIHHALIPGNGPLAGRYLIGHGSHIWWDDGGWPFGIDEFSGGAVYVFDPDSNTARSLGVPVPRNTVHGLDGGEGFAVGYSLPDNHFFSIDYETERLHDFGRLSAYCCHGFGCVGDKAVGVYRRAVGEQRGDLVVAADHAAYLFVYDHSRRELKRTDCRIADLDVNIRFNSGIDSWLAVDSGVIGARVDGSLFRVDVEERAVEEIGYAVPPTEPSLTAEQVRRLGGSKCTGIHGAERVTAMVSLDERWIVGTAGFPVMRLFMMDTNTDQRIDLGPVNPEAEMCYFHDLAVTRGPDGRRRLVLAETDSECPDIYVVDDPTAQPSPAAHV